MTDLGQDTTRKCSRKQLEVSIQTIQLMTTRISVRVSHQETKTSSIAQLTAQTSGETRSRLHSQSRHILRILDRALISLIRRKETILRASSLLRRLSTSHLEAWTQGIATSTRAPKCQAQERTSTSTTLTTRRFAKA